MQRPEMIVNLTMLRAPLPLGEFGGDHRDLSYLAK
jgi:hypothetical protein